MKDSLPSWPQMLVICACGVAAIVAGCLFSRLRGSWGPPTWGALSVMVLAGLGFAVAVFLFYLRPQYGPRAFPALLLMLGGHLLFVLLLFKAGVAR